MLNKIKWQAFVHVFLTAYRVPLVIGVHSRDNWIDREENLPLQHSDKNLMHHDQNTTFIIKVVFT